jgi:hypothetical protein
VVAKVLASVRRAAPSRSPSASSRFSMSAILAWDALTLDVVSISAAASFA